MYMIFVEPSLQHDLGHVAAYGETMHLWNDQQKNILKPVLDVLAIEWPSTRRALIPASVSD